MNPARIAHRHARAVVLLTVFLAVAGVIALRSLPSSIYPPLQFPRVIVLARSGTTPAHSMMLTVTRPLEQAAMEVPGIRRVRSRTFRGATEISAYFEPSTDMLAALHAVESRIGDARAGLPGEVEIEVERLSPAAFPILSLNLNGGLPDADLRDYAFYVIRPALARVAGVGRIEVQSSDEREIEVPVSTGSKVFTKTRRGITVFAGLRDDPFFFDLTQFRLVVSGQAPSFRNPGIDTFKGFNTLAIVVEVPAEMLGSSPNVGIWGTTSRPRY